MIETSNTSNTLYVLGDKEDLKKFQDPLPLSSFEDIKEIRCALSSELELVYLITSLSDPIVPQVERLASAWPRLTFLLLYLNNEKSIAGTFEFRGGLCQERREYSICKNSEPDQIQTYNDFVDDYFLKFWLGVRKGESCRALYPQVGLLDEEESDLRDEEWSTHSYD